MCTAITYKTQNHYFGRNLDLEHSYLETVTITPRNYVFQFRKAGKMEHHFAMIGMAYISDGYPLYYDATNEKGLSIAGLNFPENAVYNPCCAGKDNVTPFELIPWILGQCETVSDAENLLKRMNLLNENFNEALPLTPLHWMISDRVRTITVEPMKDGIQIHNNPVGVLTNNPPFDYQMFHLNDFMRLTPNEPKNTFISENSHLKLNPYSRGMGAMGLPGDASSMSRFVRATFIKLNSVSGNSEAEGVSQFFHILKAVEMQRGCVRLENGMYETTVYTSCCNIDRGIYYYTTYDNSSLCAVDLHRENLEKDELIAYHLQKEGKVIYQN